MTGKWEYGVSKAALAEALWPTLKAKIDRLQPSHDQAGQPTSAHTRSMINSRYSKWHWLLAPGTVLITWSKRIA